MGSSHSNTNSTKTPHPKTPPPLNCPLTCFCNTTFPNPTALYQHATSCGHRVKCSCGKLVAGISELKKHQRDVAVHDVNVPKMGHEKLTALWGLPGLNAPLRTSQVSSSAGSGSYSCRFCKDKVFQSPEALEQHKAAKHPRCSCCGKVFHEKYGKKARSAREGLDGHLRGTGHGYGREGDEMGKGKGHLATTTLDQGEPRASSSLRLDKEGDDGAGDDTSRDEDGVPETGGVGLGV